MSHSSHKSVARSASRHNTGAATSDSRQQPPVATPATMGHRRWVYLLLFVLCYLFSTLVYGDIFRRAAEANFITTDSQQMKFLTQQSWGSLYLVGRWMLVSFKSRYIGALLLSLLLTATAWQTDYLLGVGRRWHGVGSIVPATLVAWMIYRGANLYYKYEPSLFLLLPLLAVIALGVLALIRRIAVHTPPPRRGMAWGAVCVVVCFAALTAAARYFNENEILTARMQLRTQQADWEGIIDDALSARRPSRAVAVYYAIALQQTGQLLDRMYDIRYDFPTVRLKKKDGNEEYGLFLPDANLYAGLTNIGYRCFFDYTVINGPSVYYLKRMAQCAILNDEPALARKYLSILRSTPGEKDFVERYAPLVDNRDAVKEDTELANILALAPTSPYFEQNYRSPAFLGYNAGLLSGTDTSLGTAIAACLYTKEIANCLPHIRIYAQKTGTLPVAVQQALAVIGNTNPAVAQEFATYIHAQESALVAFVTAAKPLIDERMQLSKGKSDAEKERIKYEYNTKLRQALADDWIGTYFYYYYCENNNQNQVKPKTQSAVN